MSERILFYAFSALMLGGALAVLFAQRLLRAVLYFMVVLAGVTGFYVLLQADFLAVLQVLIYVGGIAVLLAFGVMLTGPGEIGIERPGRLPALGALVSAALACAFILTGIYKTDLGNFAPAVSEQGTSSLLGVLFLQQNVFAFELASVLLLLVLVGVALVIRKGRTAS